MYVCEYGYIVFLKIIWKGLILKYFLDYLIEDRNPLTASLKNELLSQLQFTRWKHELEKN